MSSRQTGQRGRPHRHDDRDPRDHNHDHGHHHNYDHGHDHGHDHSFGGHHHGPESAGGLTRARFLSGLAAAVAFPAMALGRTPTSSEAIERAERYRIRTEEAEQGELGQLFKGITTNGTVVPDLFRVAPSGVPTEPMRLAAERFIATLTNTQLVRTMFPIDDIQWRRWANQNFYARQGICFREMTDEQRSAALNLLSVSLSSRGFELTRNIMRLNATLAELTGIDLVLGEWAYYLTFMGVPSSTDPWGWQFQGPHAIINCFVLGDQLVMTPLFLGSEPAHAWSGQYAGLSVLQQEQDDGLGMITALSGAEQRQAILSFSKMGDNNLTEAFSDNVVLDYAGLRTDGLNARSRGQLRDLIALYVGNLGEGHAQVRMDEIDRHLDRTFFAWIGGTAPDSVFYYRIQSPVVLIEFDHQQPVGLAKILTHPDKPTRQHVHCVVRTPNGNDYGHDLLRQHYLTHPHPRGD